MCEPVGTLSCYIEKNVLQSFKTCNGRNVSCVMAALCEGGGGGGGGGSKVT